jgi:protoporphyrinogen oxidase
MFTEGAASIPKNGIQAVPNQLMAKLPRENVRLNTRVTSFAKGQVQATSGNITIRYACQHVVLASDPLSAGRFLQDNTAFSIPEARR